MTETTFDVHVEREFDAPIERVWAVLRDAGTHRLLLFPGFRLLLERGHRRRWRQRRAEQRVSREKEQASNQTMSSALSVGGSLLGALLGGRRRSVRG